MSPFFKFECPSQLRPYCLYLGESYSIQKQAVKDFLHAVYTVHMYCLRIFKGLGKGLGQVCTIGHPKDLDHRRAAS